MQPAQANAVSEALGGHGVGRARKPSVQAVRGPPAAGPGSPNRAIPVAGMGPSPFISPRFQQQPQSAQPSPHEIAASRLRTSLAIARRGQRGSQQQAAAEELSPPTTTSPGQRVRPPPVTVDTTQATATHTPAPMSPRRRAPSDHHSKHPAQGVLRKPSSGAGATARPAIAPPPPVALLSSVFLRRKPAPSSPTERQLATATATAPQTLYFQDTDSETSSQRHRSSDADARSSSHESSSHTATTATSTSDKDGDNDLEQGVKPSGSPRKRPPSHHLLPGIEKLGELSRDEEGYDFAILLKPSKVEEHLEMGVFFHRTASAADVHSGVALSADGDGEAATATAATGTPFKLPGTPRSQLRKLKHDPASARLEITARITATGLQVKRLLSLDGKQSLLKVKAPPRVLELGAERLRLRKRRKFDQIWMEFACELRETFADFDAASDSVRFLDSEKQSIVHALLTGDVGVGGGAGLNEFCPLKTRHVLKMFPLHKHDELQALRHQWVTYWRTPPRTSSTSIRWLPRLATHALEQPLDAVAQYYGERIAYYFAWLELYTTWLVAPSVAGVLLFALQVHGKTLDHPLASVYALAMALWMSAFLLAWRRRAAALAYRWGTLGYEDDEVTRPEFVGDAALSTATHKVYPAWKRTLQYFVTVPSVVVAIALVLLLTFAAFSTRDRLEARSIAVKAEAADLAKDIAADLEHGLTLANFKRLTALGMDWDFWFYFLITPLLYGLLIPVLDYAFTIFARRLTNWENHETESTHQRHLILKVFGFRFVHVFASLYYYAFQAGSGQQQGQDGLLRVAIQLASFMVTDQLYRNAMQTLYPFVMRRVHARRKRQATNAQFHQSTVFNQAGGQRRHHFHSTAAAAATATSNNALIHEQCVRLEQASDHAWEEAELDEYDTFEDYTEMLIQVGYVTFFSLAFPLAPLLALVNNVGELRMDAFKLCHARQRPLARKASGVGVWLDVLQFMSVLAVLTNCLHIAFTTTQLERWLPRLEPTHKVWIVFGVEHVILAIKVGMALVVAPMPAHVQRQVQKEREHAKIESARAMAAKIQSQQLQQHAEETAAEATLRRRSTAAAHEELPTPVE